MSLEEKINKIVDGFVRAYNGVELLKERKQLTDKFVADALEVIKDDRIAQLETTVKNLRQQLKAARENLTRMHRRQYRDDHDSLPYEEDDRR